MTHELPGRVTAYAGNVASRGIIRFPSKAAAMDLYDDPDYQEAKRIRQASTKNVSMVLVEEFQPPSAAK